jgi:hypothetical protein
LTDDGQTTSHSRRTVVPVDCQTGHIHITLLSTTSTHDTMDLNPQSDAASCASSPSKAVPLPPSTIIPQLAEHGITEQDLATTIKTLKAIATLDPKNKKNRKRKASAVDENASTTNDDEEEDPLLSAYKHSSLRPLRKALASCLTIHQQTMYSGKSESEFYQQRNSERSLKRQKMAERAQQRKYVEATILRRGRNEKLQKLMEEGGGGDNDGAGGGVSEEGRKLLGYLVPDGHVDTEDNANGGDDALMLANGDGEDDTKQSKVLPNLRSCYVCKIRFRHLHHFYDQLCPTCASLNYTKRHQSADMSSKVAIVTGSRVKIGFQVCLKLLRAGCTVVATTRFPNCAVESYRREKDWGEWKDRLHVYGLDLRDVTGLEAFTRYLKVTFGEKGIDVLINNACQTVRRPGGYYLPLVEKERELWSKGDEDHKSVLGGCVEFERIRRKLVTDHSGGDGDGVMLLSSGGSSKLIEGGGAEQSAGSGKQFSLEMVSSQASSSDKTIKSTPFESTGISHSAAMSQMVIVPEDVGVDEKVLPPGLSDINGHQLDLRSHNSWLLKMDQVSTPEVMEW